MLIEEYTFKDPYLLSSALTHTSVAGSDRNAFERLEFLGDRVLGLVIAEILFVKFPQKSEGELAQLYTRLVCRQALSVVAKNVGLDSRMRLSSAEERAGGRENPKILADMCEALLGALYIDGGLNCVSGFIKDYWSSIIDTVQRSPHKDPKTALQELSLQKKYGLPIYKTELVEGPSHHLWFTVRVSVPSMGEAVGQGKTKRSAQQEAARSLLECSE